MIIRLNGMKTLKIVLTVIFAVIMILAGINHMLNPGLYQPFIPDWIPLLITNIFVGAIEIAIGIGLMLPPYRRKAAILLFILMVLFLPLHVADVFKMHPAIGSHTLAYIRLPLQFVLIYWAWYIFKVSKIKTA